MAGCGNKSHRATPDTWSILGGLRDWLMSSIKELWLGKILREVRIPWMGTGKGESIAKKIFGDG